MTLLLHVDSDSGHHRSNECPQSLTLDENLYDIASVEDRWYEADAEYLKVVATSGKTCLLRIEQQGDMWSLQSGTEGDELLVQDR